MNIKEFIQKTIEEMPEDVNEFDFDIGVSIRKDKIVMDSYSSDRIRFKVVRNFNES